MKLYQINDDYRGKRRYEADEGRANYVGSIWASELENIGQNPDNWIRIMALKNKNEILSALNFTNISDI